MTFRICIVISFFFISACTISSSQIDSFYRNDDKINAENYYWDLTYKNINYKLIAISLPGGTLFADKLGNSIFFDGWSIISIVGFEDFDGEIEILETQIGKLYLNNENSYLIDNDCEEWKDYQNQGGILYTQICPNHKNQINKLFVNPDGEVIEIQQYLNPFNELLTLKRSSS